MLLLIMYLFLNVNSRQHLIEWVISRMKTDGGGLTLKCLYCKAVITDSSTSPSAYNCHQLNFTLQLTAAHQTAIPVHR